MGERAMQIYGKLAFQTKETANTPEAGAHWTGPVRPVCLQSERGREGVTGRKWGQSPAPHIVLPHTVIYCTFPNVSCIHLWDSVFMQALYYACFVHLRLDSTTLSTLWVLRRCRIITYLNYFLQNMLSWLAPHQGPNGTGVPEFCFL